MKIKETNKMKLIQVGSSMLLCFAALVICLFSFSWFSNSKTVEAKNLKVQATDIKSLIISTIKNGTNNNQDISNYPSSSERLMKISLDTAQTEPIAPGSQGEFKVYVKPSGSTVLKLTPQLLAGGYDKNYNSVDDYRTGYTQGNAADSYINGHILLFLNKTGSVYSNWIDTFTGTEIAVNENLENEITIYWVWVNSYDKLCNESPIINQADITKIRSYYFTETTVPNDLAKTYIFDSRENSDYSQGKLSRYYDFADEDIGLIINHLHFELTFSVK